MHLLAEAGKEEISFLIFSRNPLVIHGFYAFSFVRNIMPGEYAENIRHIIHKEQVLVQQFSSCQIFYNGDESVLIPETYFSESNKEKIAALMFGENNATLCFHEKVNENAIHNVYRVPKTIYEVMNTSIAKNHFSHSSTSQVNNNGTGDEARCIVYHNNIKIILFKAGHLQIVRYAEYISPADVCYHLLNACQQFDVKPAEVRLVLSGMVDENSNLYNELYRYFLDINFLKLPEGITVDAKLSEQPHHFYSHLASLAQCV